MAVRTVVVPSTHLPSAPYAESLHATIVSSFRAIHKDIKAYPASWTRLKSPYERGIEGLAEELGFYGYLVVAFESESDFASVDITPVACGGFLPSRGLHWMENANSDGSFDHTGQKSSSNSTSGEISEDWEICCFCVHPSYRGQGLSRLVLDAIVAAVRARGGKRLLANFVVEESGEFWQHLGFELVPGSEGLLKKGFTHTAGMEPLREDIHFLMGVRAL